MPPVRRALVALCLSFAVAPVFAALNVSMSVPAPFANPINPGDITALRISITNSNSASTITGVAFTDTLPPQLVIAGSGLINYACVDGFGNPFATTGTVTATVGTGTISLSGGTIPLAQASGASGDCNIDVEVTSTFEGGVWTDTIPVAGVTGTDTGPVSNPSIAQQSITVNTLNPPAISKNFSLATVVKSDQTVRLTMTISNASNPAVTLPLDTAADSPPFALRDVLPASLQVAATPNATSTCTGAGVAPAFAPAAGATTLTAVGGTVAGGGTCTMMVDLVATTTGGGSSQGVTNTINRTSDFGNERGLAAAANASANLTIVSQISVSQAFNPGTVSAGQSANLVITITNASPINAETVTTFTDDPIDGVGNPAYGLKVTGTPTTTCAGGTVAATPGNTGVKLTGGTVAANSSCTITVPYVGTLQTAGTPQSFTNAIPQGAVGLTDGTIISNASSASVTVVDQLTVAKGANPTTVSPGNPIQYTLTVRNFTSTGLSNVVITDALPNGIVALPALPAAPALTGVGCTGLTTNIPALPATTSTPLFTIGAFPAGVGASPGVCTVTFWAMPPASATVGTVLSNSIAAGGVVNNGGVGVTATNAGGSGNANSTVASDITVNKVFSPASAPEGTISQLTVTFTNLSAQALTNASFTDNLPLGTPTNLQLVVANPASASSTCVGASITANPGASNFSMSGATIPARAANGTGANGTCTLKINVIGPAGTYNNTLPAGAFAGTQTYADTTTGPASSPGPISASITYSAALTAVKSFSPSTIGSGGKSTVTVRLGNVGTGTLNNVSVTDPLPTGMVVATPPNAFTTCGGSPVVTAVAGAGTVTMTGAVIPANIQCSLLFDVTATGGANWINSIPIADITATGGVENVTAVAATLNNNTTGAVSVTNNTSPNSLTAPGQFSLLTITLTNGGSIALNNLALTNYFTSDGTAGGAATPMVIASTPGASTTCPGGVVSATAGGNSIAISGASLAAAASCTISVNITLTATGTYQDTIPVGAVTTAQGISNTLLTITSLSAGANLGVTKRFFPTVTQPGVRTQLQITVINAINLPASNIAVIDNLPAGLSIPATPNASTTCTGATVTAPTATQVSLTGGSLAAATTGSSTTCQIFIDVVAAAAGSFTNTIPAGGLTATVGGSSSSNPIAGSATLGVFNPATITKAFGTNPVSPGVPSTVTITIANPNTVALTSAALMDSLPTNLSVALTPNASTTCGGVVTATASATSVSLTGATIPASGSCNLKFDTVSNTAGSYVNIIPGGNLATSQGVTNSNPATDTLRVLNPPTLAKAFSPASIPASGTATLTIFLGNTNTGAATLTSALVDTLPTSPANLVLATPNGLGGTCTTASVTAVAGSGSITYANGATVPAGGCTIIVNVTGTTAGTYNNTFAVGALQTTLGNNIQTASANLVISPLGSISGQVFKDNAVTPNGVFNPAIDTPIAGVTINLSGAASATTITDAFGNYAFTGLAAGTYTVTEPTQPTGTMNGITTAGPVTGGGGGTPGTATSVAVTPSAISNIILLGGASVANSTGNNFAEVVPSTISGLVFLDQNNDGIQEAGDTPIVGVTVQLLNAGNAVIATTTTDINGNYSFANLPPGTYSIQEPTQPVNTANGKTIAGAVPNGGTAGTPTAQTVVPSVVAGIVLPPNTMAGGNNFAEVPAGRQIIGRVFIDYNNDGIFNGTDTGLAGVTLNLTGLDFNNLPVTQTVTTAGDGSYVFGGLAAGTYNVTEPNQPSSTSNGITTAGSAGGVATAITVLPSAITGINLTGATTISTGNNFAELYAPAPLASIAGYVYVDVNNSGVYQPTDPGIGGVTIKLTGTDIRGNPVNLTTTSFPNNGAWFFQNLQPSNSAGYTITEIQPAVYADGKTTVSAGMPGTPSSTKPVAAGGNDVISGVVVGSAYLEFYNFGELSTQSGSISGIVYVDTNNNGVYDTGEPGIPGVTVTLTGTDNTGRAVSISVQTGSGGTYSFTNLAPSGSAGYTLTETQPAGYANGRNTVGSIGGALGPNDTITGIVVTAGGNGTGYNFGELNGASLTQTKTAADVTGNNYAPGDIVEYTITTINTGLAAAANVTVNEGGAGSPFPPLIGGTTATIYVANSTSSNGIAVPDVGGVSPLATSAGLNIGTLAPGATSVVKVRVQIPAGAPGGNVVNNAGFNVPAAGGTPTVTGTSTVTVKVVATMASVSGHVWLDANHNRVLDPGETLVPGWTVELLLNGTVIRSTVTDQNGFYQFTGLAPGSGYQIRFRDPTSGVIFGRAVTNEQNNGVNPTGASTTDGTLNGMTLVAGNNYVQQSLPLDPSGVVYNAVTRVPVQGATVQITGPPGFNPATNLVGGGLLNLSGATSATQVTGADGYYEFLFINLGLPGGAPPGTYVISVTPPAGQGYVTVQPSKLIPPTAASFSVPGPATGVDPIQVQDTAPPAGAATTYYLTLGFGPNSGGVVNNHIPLDPLMTGTILIQKSSSAVNVSRGDLVPYTIIATNTSTNALSNVRVSDVMPPGFKFRIGSATLNGIPTQPTVNGRELDWSGLSFAPSEKKTFKLMLIVGSGVGDGEFTNQSFASAVIVTGTAGTVISNVATATVRVAPDPTFDCPDLIGKVYDDRNFNGYQDEGEPGIPNVRLVTVEGLVVNTDAQGRYHITCPMIPNEFRGSNFVVKVDVRTLPAGYRLTTENPGTVRMTSGKLVKLNFGAALMKVYRVDVNGDAFVPGAKQLKPEWSLKVEELLAMLREKPAVVRVAYTQRNADEPAKQRMETLASDIRARWEKTKCCYTLIVETELIEAGVEKVGAAK